MNRRDGRLVSFMLSISSITFIGYRASILSSFIRLFCILPMCLRHGPKRVAMPHSISVMVSN